MRVLLQGRSARSIRTAPGGDQVALEKTAAYLRSHCAVDAHISSALEPDLAGFDAVHLFGIVRPQEVWLQARNARRHGIPIFLSTIYCDVSEFERRDRSGPVGWLGRRASPDAMEALKAGGRALVSREWSRGAATLMTRGYSRMQREVLDMTSVFIPNSRSEWNRMTTDFQLDRVSEDRVAIVPIGIDVAETSPDLVDPHEVTSLEEFRDCVLCVARMEGRKNQIRLIDSLAGSGLTVVLAGRPTPNQKRYVARVRDAAARSGSSHILGGVSAKTKLALYSLARVHLLPSWMETAGISSLEAAVMDCAIVVSPNGDTRDYFADDAHYCEPANASSIRAAVTAAYESGPSSTLAKRIRRDFTWERAAEATSAAYHRLL